ncbi:MAG: hypothetical protein R2854_03420 [Caldilineaceae bacterium]
MSLTVSGRYDLANVRYTLTGIDMVLGAPADEPCDPAAPAEPNNPTCGGSFIDRVTILSSGGRNVYAPVDPARISLVGDVITARFADTDNSGRPDAMVDGRVPVTSATGNVQVFTHRHRTFAPVRPARLGRGAGRRPRRPPRFRRRAAEHRPGFGHHLRPDRAAGTHARST